MVVVLNPRSDRTFAERVRALLADGANAPAELESALREIYPVAAVRPSVLSGKPALWYVYRDGHWVNAET